MTRYFAMWSDSSVRAGEADMGWCEELVKSGCICVRCCHLLPDIKLEKVILRRRPGNYALISVGGAVTASFLKSVGSPAGIGFVDSAHIAIFIGGWIVRRDLLTFLDTSANAAVASIFLPNGEKLNDFYLVTPERLLVRGNAHVGTAKVRGGEKAEISGVCPGCGEIRYWPGRREDRYILAQSLGHAHPIYDLWTGGLALREDIYSRVRVKNFPGVQFYEIPVRDEPVDGLPASLLPYLTPEEQATMGDILYRDANKDRRTDHGGQWLPWNAKPKLLNPKPGNDEKRYT